MKKIKLTQGQYAIVDDADYDSLNQYKWFAYKHRLGNFYAARMSPTKDGKRFFIRMSREVLGLAHRDKRQADHVLHNTLDNQRKNLRICTNQQNAMNQKTPLNKTSKHKGVSWYRSRKKWLAKIQINGKRKHLGYFKKEKDAAKAYNEVARYEFREFACLNQI